MTISPALSQLLLQAVTLHRAGERASAEQLYRQVLADCPQHPEAAVLLGRLLLDTGRVQDAIALLQAIAAHEPHKATIDLCLADAHLQAGALADAESHYRRVLEQEPTSIDALCGLGCVLAERGRLSDAEGLLRMAIALEPASGRAAAGLGTVLARQGQWAPAVEALTRARVAGHANAAALNELGVALQHLGRHEEAARAWEAAVALDGNHAPAWMNLANARRDAGDIAAARDGYARVLSIRPTDCLRIRMATLLPPVYASRQEMLDCRRAYAQGLEALLGEALHPCDPVASGGHNNFYLCYQGEDDRELQIRLAMLYRRVYVPRCRAAAKRRAGGRIRVGFVSAFFRDHTIGELNRGIIAGLSRDRFEVFVFSIGRHTDATARFIQDHAEHHGVLPAGLAEAEAQIAACGLDVLFYTDIGMEPFSYFLAFSRLAPVQCVTWGHPVTTGIDTIDYFLSSAWQEPADGVTHYSEKLAQLSLLPAYYHRPVSPGRSNRAQLGLAEASRLYVCPQSLFKFHPDFDGLLQGILEADPAAVILIPEGHHRQWTEKLQARFRRTMAGTADRVRFLPRQDYGRYLELLQVCDVMLDPLHFGGGKTTLDALSLGVPIVTLPGRFMRGRATYACYRQMGIDDCVAADGADYVRRAVRLANEPDWREAVSRELAARSVLLAERQDMVRQIEAFLEGAVESA